jgi:hypothetical protein
VHGVIDENSKPYRSLMMDAMRINQSYADECSCVDEEPNTNAPRFFELLKDFDEPLWDRCINHSKLSVIAQVFIIKSDHGLSEAGYDKIIKWARNILSIFAKVLTTLNYQSLHVCSLSSQIMG